MKGITPESVIFLESLTILDKSLTALVNEAGIHD